jgi:hypothetical protein
LAEYSALVESIGIWRTGLVRNQVIANSESAPVDYLGEVATASILAWGNSEDIRTKLAADRAIEHILNGTAYDGSSVDSIQDVIDLLSIYEWNDLEGLKNAFPR